MNKLTAKVNFFSKLKNKVMLSNALKEQFYLVLNQFAYVGDVSGDTSLMIFSFELFNPISTGGGSPPAQ